MDLLNENYRIYSASISEITLGVIRKLSNFTDETSVGSILTWYDEKNDRFVINSMYVSELLAFCELGFYRPLNRLIVRLPEFKAYREVVELIIRVRKARGEEIINKSEFANNPNSKFVCIGDDIFQISKLVSVKCRDEADKSFIEVYVTNKHASIKKQFQSRAIRDAEFGKIKKILELSA